MTGYSGGKPYKANNMKLLHYSSSLAGVSVGCKSSLKSCKGTMDLSQISRNRIINLARSNDIHEALVDTIEMCVIGVKNLG